MLQRRIGHRPALAPACAAPKPPAYTFKTIDYPGSATILHGVNVSGTVVADFNDVNGNANCFTVIKKKQTLLSDPKGSVSFCANINKSGAIVGYYLTGSTNIGYIYAGGKFTDVPGPVGSVYSQVYSVSDKGVMVGAWVDASDNEHGFLLKGKTYTSFDAPNSTDTLGVGINNAGVYTAQGFDVQGNVHSYLIKGGKTTELIFPGAIATRVHAINNKGQMALAWVDSGNVKHGGIYDSKTGAYTQIDAPNAAYTAIMGIDDKQTLAGNFIANNGNDQEGFEATLK
jgi:hypothetical protein